MIIVLKLVLHSKCSVNAGVCYILSLAKLIQKCLSLYWEGTAEWADVSYLATVRDLFSVTSSPLLHPIHSLTCSAFMVCCLAWCEELKKAAFQSC